MGLFEHWPYTNFHDINLNWIISKIKNIETAEQSTAASEQAAAASADAAAASAESAQASAENAASSEESAGQSAESAQNYAEHIADPVGGLVTTWLDENIEPTTPPIDSSLTVQGAAADAKATGLAIAQHGGVNSAARNLFKVILESALYRTDQSANIDALIAALNPGTPVQIYTITYSLTNVTSSVNDPTVTGGESFTCVLTADTDYTMGTVTVMMGGSDITSTSYSNGTVSIPIVTGNIVITATATALPVVRWDYSAGRLPSADDGISTTFNGSNYSLSFDATKGIVATGGTADSEVIRFTPTNYETCTKGYFEALLTIASISGTGNLASRLSNGTNGWNVLFALYGGRTQEICYKTTSASNNHVGPNGTLFETNTEYKFRIDYEENGNNKIYLNDELLYDGDAVSTYYTTINRLLIAGTITVNIKSMKWVIEEA